MWAKRKILRFVGKYGKKINVGGKNGFRFHKRKNFIHKNVAIQ